MLKQSLILNVIPFAPLQSEQSFTFYTRDKGNLQRVHKNKILGLWEGFLTEEDLDEGNFFYTDFTVHEDGLTFSIDLTDKIHLAAHYYRFLLREHFKEIADVISSSYTKEPEVWFKHDKQTDSRFTLYNVFTLKVQHERLTRGPELVLSYDGQTKVLNKSISDLGSFDTTKLNWIKCGRALHKYIDMPVEYKQNLNELFPVLTNKLKPAFNIGFDIPTTTNRYPKYWGHLNKFYNDHLDTDKFKQVFTLSSEGFLALPESSIQMTLPGANDLLFGLNRVGTEPKTDMRRKGPYKPAAAPNVRFLFIYHVADKQGALKQLYNYLKSGMTSKDGNGKDYLAFPPLIDFIKQPLLLDETPNIEFQSIDTAVEEVQRAVKILPKKPYVQYIAIYVTPVNRFVENDEHKKVYYQIKEILLQEGITSQVIYKDNITKDAFKFYLPNIEIAILAKLGGIPWRLNRVKTDELIVGIGAFYSITRKSRFVGSAFCFNNEGIFEGFDCFGAEDTKMLAGSIRKAVGRYIAEYYTAKRLIIHFYKDISKKEIQPIIDTLHAMGIPIPVIILTINKTESKELLAFDIKDTTNLMPYSGTIIKVGRREFLLFNNTRYNATSQITAKEYHFPVKVSFAATQPELLEDENVITELMDQVYQFSRMYWKSVSQQNLPVTIKYPEMVAQIYSHFKGNTLPEFARKNLWFL